LIAMGSINWIFAVGFFLAAYLSSIIFSLYTLLSEELTFNQYEKKGVGFKLIITALLEPLLLHPLSLYAAMKGNYDYYFNKKKKWGVMIRKGMSSK